MKAPHLLLCPILLFIPFPFMFFGSVTTLIWSLSLSAPPLAVGPGPSQEFRQDQSWEHRWRTLPRPPCCAAGLDSKLPALPQGPAPVLSPNCGQTRGAAGPHHPLPPPDRAQGQRMLSPFSLSPTTDLQHTLQVQYPCVISPLQAPRDLFPDLLKPVLR